MSYTQSIQLADNEVAAKINQSTGEIKPVNKRSNNIPKGKEVFEPDSIFTKDYSNAWAFLCRELSHLEIATTVRLIQLSKNNTNTLAPLNDDTTLKELSDTLQVSINKIKVVLKRLWELGIYGKFDVAEVDKLYTKYWILNPYLAFKGRIINSDIAQLFKNTHIAKAHFDAEYTYMKDKEQSPKKRSKKSLITN
jgi:hypothetical protein